MLCDVLCQWMISNPVVLYASRIDATYVHSRLYDIAEAAPTNNNTKIPSISTSIKAATLWLKVYYCTGSMNVTAFASAQDDGRGIMVMGLDAVQY